jgi:cytochrome P450
VEHFALPVPSTVICRVLGVPYEQHELFERRTAIMINTRSTPADVRAAAMEVYSYLAELVALRQKEQEEDLISRFVTAYVEPGHLPPAELAMISMLLLAGAHETTASMIAAGILTLLEHPGQLALLRERPELTPDAVEELLRYLTVAQVGTFRVATADMTIAGRQIRAGDGVIADLAGANWDPAAFANPEKLDITRKARRHVAFSHGPHNCVGQSLARLELEVSYRRLLERFPRLALAADPAELRYRPYTVGLAGVEQLPVTW